jgi:hypothetical protein
MAPATKGPAKRKAEHQLEDDNVPGVMDAHPEYRVKVVETDEGGGIRGKLYLHLFTIVITLFNFVNFNLWFIFVE